MATYKDMMGGIRGPKQIIRGKLRPIKDDVIGYNMHFGEQQTASGIIITNDDGKERGIYPRWCQVYAKGPENKEEYQVDDWILVSHGRWSRGVILEDDDGNKNEIRKIDVNEILMVSSEKPRDIRLGHEQDYSPDKVRAEDFGAN